jgi:hypothetical protein
MFVVAAGLIGLLLGVALSLAADSIAGGHLSEPIPLRIRPDATTSPVPNATRSNDQQDSNRPDGGHDSGSGMHDAGSDSHGGSSGEDD